MWRATVRQGAQACQVNYVSQSVYYLGVGVLDFSTSKHSSLQRLRLNILTNMSSGSNTVSLGMSCYQA
jgi:hypothetical protein